MKNEGELYYKEQINVKRLNSAFYLLKDYPKLQNLILIILLFDIFCFKISYLYIILYDC